MTSRAGGESFSSTRLIRSLAASASSVALPGSATKRSSQSVSGSLSSENADSRLRWCPRKKIVTRPHRHPHEPVFERRLAPETGKLGKRLEPGLPARCPRPRCHGGRSGARWRRRAGNTFWTSGSKLAGVAFQHRRNQLRFSPFHFESVPEKRSKSKNPLAFTTG